MAKRKLPGIILLVLAIILIITGAIITVISTQPTQIETKEERKDSTKEIIDGELTNIEESFTKQRTFKTYRFKNFRISEQGQYYSFKVIVDNIGQTIAEETTLKITFYANNKDELANLEITIPELQPNESKEIESLSSAPAIFETFDIKITEKTSQSA